MKGKYTLLFQKLCVCARHTRWTKFMAAKYFIPEATPLAMPTSCRSVNCPSFFFKKLSKDPFAMYSMTIICGMPKIWRDFSLNWSHHIGRHVTFSCTADTETIAFCNNLTPFIVQEIKIKRIEPLKRKGFIQLATTTLTFLQTIQMWITCFKNTSSYIHAMIYFRCI